ncbi:MAG TPA: FtsX-like permease family protein [Bryobacteraceae bacterium]|nr:FtsX-like permease family protein [Bryobacteraceae bacterium]
MRLLRLISWQYVRKHLLRTVLTMAGIVLGVAVFVGMHTANQSVLSAFNKTVDRIAGATQLQITAGESGFDEEVLERVQAVPGVRVAVPVIEAVVNLHLQSQSNILVLAVDMTGDRSLRDYDLEEGEDTVVEDPLVFISQPDSLMVTHEFAAANRLVINSKITLDSMDGPRTFTVRGVMKSSGLTSAFGGNLAIMDIYAAQKVFGRGRKFDRIDLAAAEGTSVPALQQQLQTLLGAGFEVEPPSARGKQFESLTSVYGMLANITSLFALFIGMFIIYNSFAIAVTQRRSEIGIVRALGATRRQIQNLFLMESAMLGLIGATAGLLLGLGIARGISTSLGNFLGEIYGVAQKAEEVSSDPRLLLGALLMGVVTSVIAAWIPARAAAGVDPVQALQKGRYQQLSEGENRIRRQIAAGLFVVVVFCLFFSQNRAVFYSGYFLTVIAGLLLVPTIALWLSKAIRPVMRYLRPVEGALAADSLIQSPRRTSGAVSALALSIALVISLGGMARASYDSIEEWMRIALNPDIFLTPTQNITDRSFRFPASIAEEVSKLPGIHYTQFVRNARMMYEGNPVMFVALDIGNLRPESHLPAVEGDATSMYKQAAEGKGFLISDNFAELYKVKYRQKLTVNTPTGPLSLPVLGIVRDYSDQKGSILLDRSVFIRHWRDDTVNVVRIYLNKDTTVTQMRARIEERLAGKTRLFVFTNQDLKAYIIKITDQWFGLTYIQLAVAVLVAILGIINTLTVSITDRRRELGVLQAVGALRNQVRGTIWLEAVAIGVIGLAIGLVFGSVALYYSLEMSARDIAGLRLDYTYPWNMAAGLFPIITGAALFAALGPAEQAVRGGLVEALEYE